MGLCQRSDASFERFLSLRRGPVTERLCCDGYHRRERILDSMAEFSNEQIERLQENVARELGFRLIGHRLELFGMPLKNGKS